MEKAPLIESKLIVLWRLLRRSFKVLKRNDPLRIAGATAFFTSFALPPIILILFQLFSLFLDRKMVGTEMMDTFRATIGEGGANQIRQTARGFRLLFNTWYTAVGGFLFLAFVATTLFGVIKNTFNDIWNIRVDKNSFLYGLKLRARSLGVILAAGILFLAGMILDAFEVFAGKYIGKIWPSGGAFFTSALNEIVGAVIVTTWFVVLFRFLANARPTWKACFIGGIVTGIFFSAGKALLAAAISNSNAGAIYGPAGSIVLILLFVFYSSFILYFGASFIHVYSLEFNQPIRPLTGAYRFQVSKLEDDD